MRCILERQRLNEIDEVIRPEGATTNQPRATPWVGEQK
jgi:hypothetical protein